jgi:hypothetical protein
MKALRTVELILLATISFALAAVSCTSTDPQWAALVGKHETNPRPDAVVGTWYDRVHTDGAAHMLVDQYLTLNADGTGTQKYKGGGTALGVVEHFERADPVTWKYAGGGTWTFSRESPWIGGLSTGNIQLAGGRLLLTTRTSGPAPGLGFRNHQIFVNTLDSLGMADERLRDNLLREKPAIGN